MSHTIWTSLGILYSRLYQQEVCEKHRTVTNDMDEGDISEYLEIMVKYHDGVENVAMYQLSPKEQEMFLRKMDEYCISTMGQSLEDMCQRHRQNMEQTM